MVKDVLIDFAQFFRIWLDRSSAPVVTFNLILNYLGLSINDLDGYVQMHLYAYMYM